MLIYIAIFIFSVLLFFMSMKQGTQTSISQLAKEQWPILVIALLSQMLLLYPMIEMTPLAWQFLPFIGCGAILLTGITNIFNKEDELAHIIAAFVSFICFIIWIVLINFKCLLPLIICLVAGKQNLKWRAEIGLIISVYMALIL